jgi:hypothetical protein
MFLFLFPFCLIKLMHEIIHYELQTREFLTRQDCHVQATLALSALTSFLRT